MNGGSFSRDAAVGVDLRKFSRGTPLDFVGSHILSVDQFTREDIEHVFRVADDMQPYADRERVTRVLQGAILSNMFFEPSTRTRISFGSAFNMLGGEVRETTEVAASSLTKGESLYDTARVLSGYSDVIVMRHPEAGSVAEFAKASRVPVINAGDGPNEHPSQALLDLYTIRKEMESRGRAIDDLRIALVGDLRYGRAVHSLCKLLALFEHVHYKLVSPPELSLPADIVASLRAAGHDVEMIVLSIGGNDLGFADIIIDCTIEYNTSPSWWPNTCNGEQQANVDARMASAMAGVGTAIDEIRAVMSAAGDTDYRLVLQIPRGSEFRYSESGWDRTTIGGCPFWNVDASWARDSLVPQISDNLAAVAAAKGVEFLDLSDQLEGREVCSVNTSQGTGAGAEWARFLVTGITQGEAQESMHPNAYGQQSAGTCLALLHGAVPGNYSCDNVAGQGPDVMTLTAG